MCITRANGKATFLSMPKNRSIAVIIANSKVPMPAGSEGALVAKNMVASTTSTAWGRVRGMPISSATIQPQTPRQTHVARLTRTEASSRFLCRSSSATEFGEGGYYLHSPEE